MLVATKICFTLLVLWEPHFFLEIPELRRYDRKWQAVFKQGIETPQTFLLQEMVRIPL